MGIRQFHCIIIYKINLAALKVPASLFDSIRMTPMINSRINLFDGIYEAV